MAADAPYPQRESHFAFRFVRLLGKVCAAQTLGTDGVWLLTTIAMTEDAARYRGPVTYWNNHLLQLLGISTWRRFERVRKRAIDAGWLVYSPGPTGSRLPGKYFVTIPAECEGLDDTPLSEDRIHVESEGSICQNGITNDTSSGETICHGDTSSDITSGISSDISFYPSPSPSPKYISSDSKPSTGKARKGKATADPIVEEIYGVFPRKGERPDVLKMITNAISSGVSAEEILDKAKLFAQKCEGGDPQYIKSAKGWMKGECWKDDPSTWATGHSGKAKQLSRAYANHDSNLMQIVDAD